MLVLMISDNFMEVPGWLYLMVLLVYVGIHAYGSTVLSARFFVPAKFRGTAESNAVALTFDDGPIEGKTERILDLLEQRKLKASFFCIGHLVNTNPRIAKRILDDGHVISNHSYWHAKTFDLQTSDKIAWELDETNKAIEKATGRKPRLFRPPYGVTNPMVASAIKQGGFATIGWSIRSFDTVTKDSEALFKRVTRSIRGGDVILFHDFSDSSFQILPRLIDHIQHLGLKFVTVDELLNERAYE